MIELFNLHVLTYSESPDTYNSLGESDTISGDREPAIQNYKQSLQLNPDNKNAVKMLKRLK